MRIDNSNKHITPNFTAIRVANIKNNIGNRTTSIDLYQIRREDFGFLQKLAQKIDINKICTNLSETHRQRWDRVFRYCVESAFRFGNQTYLAVCNNRPCGIMTYIASKNIFLDGICAIPDENGKRTLNIGQTMLHKLFKIANENNAQNITLKAVADGPFNIVEKYENIGFKKDIDQDSDYINMTCNKYKVKEQLENFKKTQEYSELDNERVLLYKIID